jgi:hypothetical protein
MRGGISRNLPWPGRKARSRVSKAGPNRRRSRESPRGWSWRETGKASAQPRPERGSSKGFRPWRRAPGKRQGLRAAPRSEKGDRRGFGPDASPGDGAASAGPDPTGKLWSGFRSRPGDPTGIGEGLSGLSRDPAETERGFAASLRIPQESDAGPAPAARSEAAQRETASLPSDGSQSWDKWGPVATPAPILILGPVVLPLARLAPFPPRR